MAKWVVAMVALVAVSGCTRYVDSPQPRPQPAVAAPITAQQIHDLLSKNVEAANGNVFVSVEPDRCSGVARETDPPFLTSLNPVATDEGYWVTTEGPESHIEELVAVYQPSFDPAAALAAARKTIDSCLGTPLRVTTTRGDTYEFDSVSRADSGSDAIVLWSFQGVDWRCDNALISAHNAAIEITTCGPTGGFDVASAAKDALERIEKLANTAA